MKSTPETRSMAQSVLDYIEAHPEKHNQDDWFEVDGHMQTVTEENFCNTTMCIAGTALFMKEGLDGLNWAALSDAEGISSRAGEMLGLDYKEADVLFYIMDKFVALDALRAVANGDEDKFEEVTAYYKDW